MPLTDPARELATTLEKLAAPPNHHVDERIASSLGRTAWSPEILKVLFEIDRRCALVAEEIRRLNLDEDVAQEAQQSLAQMRGVVGSKAILSRTTDQIRQTISGSNITILKMLSAQVREQTAYELLSPQQRSELIADVEELITWLDKLQSDEGDFIRQALIEGLREFVFRASNLDWFGTGYTLSSLKEVMQAYLVLEGAIALSPDNNELTRAVQLKAKACLVKVFGAFKIVKETADTAGWALKAYGAVAAIADGSQAISGLIGN